MTRRRPARRLTPASKTAKPRHVDLRAFVYVRGTAAEDCTLADLALTRVAPDGSLVVNSSRGGGAKDTWIIGEAEVMPSPTEGNQ